MATLSPSGGKTGVFHLYSRLEEHGSKHLDGMLTDNVEENYSFLIFSTSALVEQSSTNFKTLTSP